MDTELTISPTSSTVDSIAVTITNDREVEGNENFFLLLNSSNPSAQLGVVMATVTVADDDIREYFFLSFCLFLSVCRSVHPFVYSSVYLPIALLSVCPVCLFVCLFVCLSVCLSVCPAVNPSVFSSVCLSAVSLYIRSSLHLSICLSVCLSYLSVCMVGDGYALV